MTTFLKRKFLDKIWFVVDGVTSWWCHDHDELIIVNVCANVDTRECVNREQAHTHERVAERAARRRKDESPAVVVHCVVDDEVGFSRRFYRVRDNSRCRKLNTVLAVNKRALII